MQVSYPDVDIKESNGEGADDEILIPETGQEPEHANELDKTSKGKGNSYNENEESNSDSQVKKNDLSNNHVGKCPRICMDGLTGSMGEYVKNLITSFASLHGTLGGLVDCGASTVSSASKDLYKILDPLTYITGSSSEVLSSLNNTLQDVFYSMTYVVSRLQIQTLATTVTGAISDLRKSLTEAVKIVDDAKSFDVTKNLNAAIILVLTYVQVMASTISVITEATSKAIGSVSSEVQEAVVSLTLVLGTVLVIVQSVSASIACVLSPLQTVPSTLTPFLTTLDGTINSIIGVITSITSSITASISVAIDVISVTLSYITTNLTASLGSIRSSTVSEVTNSLSSILDRLSGSASDITTSITSSVKSILSSLKAVSSTSAGLLSVRASQMNSVFQILTVLSGSENAIVTILISSLPNIFDTINSALNSLQSGIGTAILDELTKFTYNFQQSLNGCLDLLSGLSTKLNANDVEQYAQIISKWIQYFAGTVVAFTSTIAEAINTDDVKEANMEAALALQFILSAAVYLAQWVVSLGTLIYESTTGSESEVLSKFTVLVSVTLHSLSKICETIAESLYYDSLSDVLNSIESSVARLGTHAISSFTQITNVVVNFAFTFDQIESGVKEQVDKSAADIVNGTEGTVSEILSILTGKLGSISPVLSSSVSSILNSLREISTVGSKALKIISQLLLMVVLQVVGVNGSSSHILSLTSIFLSEAFGQLSKLVSKLSVLGEVSVSFNVSVSDIHSALRALISAINDCSGNLSVLNDPVKKVAETVQILISTFFAIVDTVSRASDDIVNRLSDALSYISYVMSTIVLIVQHVLGASVIHLLVIFGNINPVLQQLILAMSLTLQSITSIVADSTELLTTGSDFAVVIRKIVSSVSDLNNLASSSLGEITGIRANINVSVNKSDEI